MPSRSSKSIAFSRSSASLYRRYISTSPSLKSSEMSLITSSGASSAALFLIVLNRLRTALGVICPSERLCSCMIFLTSTVLSSVS